MRSTSTILSSTSALALMLATPALAQDQTGPATPPDPTVEAQEQPADPEAGSPQTDDAVQTATGQDQTTTDDEVIVVTALGESSCGREAGDPCADDDRAHLLHRAAP